LRVLLGLGVAEEKLVEMFGFSGLSRYEKMLAEQEAKGAEGDRAPARRGRGWLTISRKARTRTTSAGTPRRC
jgi:hypothetical protein